MQIFSYRLIDWQGKHGRHHLPWQLNRTPYRVWLSEIMLQQTQVASVIPYFERFVARFPEVSSLAQATTEDVLALWSGLGYYSRARYLHRAAQMVVAQFGGEFPLNSQLLQQLPGVGASTAAAIASFCAGERVAIFDGNVQRVLSRHAGIALYPETRPARAQLYALAENLLPQAEDMPVYSQAIMDLGATICTRNQPDCHHCPVSADCVARCENRVHMLPGKKSRPVVAKVSVWLVRFQYQHRAWLERRPDRGIWGGMWCLPWLEAEPDGNGLCQQKWGVPALRVSQGKPFTHLLTHRHLSITPLSIELAVPPQQEHEGWWAEENEWQQAGIPVPVRKICAADVQS